VDPRQVAHGRGQLAGFGVPAGGGKIQASGSFEINGHLQESRRVGVVLPLRWAVRPMGRPPELAEPPLDALQYDG
jgi:hypothetical protein